MIEQFHQGRPETADIRQDDRLVMAAELRPGHYLDNLLQRADAAGERDESVGFLEHPVLAGVHVFGHDEFVEAGERGFGRLFGDEETRNDADDGSAGAAYGGGDRPHDALAAAAIDEP